MIFNRSKALLFHRNEKKRKQKLFLDSLDSRRDHVFVLDPVKEMEEELTSYQFTTTSIDRSNSLTSFSSRSTVDAMDIEVDDDCHQYHHPLRQHSFPPPPPSPAPPAPRGRQYNHYITSFLLFCAVLTFSGAKMLVIIQAAMPIVVIMMFMFGLSETKSLLNRWIQFSQKSELKQDKRKSFWYRSRVFFQPWLRLHHEHERSTTRFGIYGSDRKLSFSEYKNIKGRLAAVGFVTKTYNRLLSPDAIRDQFSNINLNVINDADEQLQQLDQIHSYHNFESRRKESIFMKKE